MLNILSYQRNANQNNSEIPSYTCENSQDQKHWWRGCGEEGTLLYCWWECKLVQPLWIWIFLRKLGNNLPQDPAIPLLGIYPKDAQSCHKDMCSTMFIAALFVIDRIWKQPPSRPSNTTFGYISTGCSIVPQGHVLNYVHISIIYNNKNMETTYIHHNQRMNEEKCGTFTKRSTTQL